MLQCDMKDAALQLSGRGMRPMASADTAGANTVSANRLRKQAARCQALAKQTHDEDGRRRYLRLEQMYLQLADLNSGIRAFADPLTRA
jgi:hypothetical protein